MPGIEGIAGGGAHNGPALIRSEPAPEQAYSPRVRLGGDKNHRAIVFARHRGSNDPDFVHGIHDRRLEDVNRLRRHSFVNQNEIVVMVLAGKGNAHLFQSFAGLSGIGKPDFRRVAFAEELRRFEGPQGHRSAEHDDRSGFH